MSTTQSERTKQRRRLLKSAAAVPAIFALPAGAQVANSSINACVIRGLHANGLPDSPVTEPDGWVRQNEGTMQNPSYVAQRNDQANNDFVYGASCWNSVQAATGRGPTATPGSNLLIP